MIDNSSEEPWRGFASDNFAGVHPEVLDVIESVNVGHQSAYGDDTVTALATSMIRDLLGGRPSSYRSSTVLAPTSSRFSRPPRVGSRSSARQPRTFTLTKVVHRSQ